MTARPTLPTRLGIDALWRMWCLAYYRWALREISPMHPDVPHIVQKINVLERA